MRDTIIKYYLCYVMFMVRESPPWCSIVGAIVTVHQFFCILRVCVYNILVIISTVLYLHTSSIETLNG